MNLVPFAPIFDKDVRVVLRRLVSLMVEVGQLTRASTWRPFGRYPKWLLRFDARNFTVEDLDGNFEAAFTWTDLVPFLMLDVDPDQIGYCEESAEPRTNHRHLH